MGLDFLDYLIMLMMISICPILNNFQNHHPWQ